MSSPDLDIGVIYTHERELMPRLLGTMAASGQGLRMRLILVDNDSTDGVEPWRGYFAETAGGKSSWSGTLPVAAGIAADYTVSAALTGQDGIDRDSAMSEAVRYTVPFPPGPTPGSPTGPTISRP